MPPLMLNPSATVDLFSKIVCGPYVGLVLQGRRKTPVILTSRYLTDVPADAPMRPVIPADLAQRVLAAWCRGGAQDPSMPVWAAVWDHRDVFVAELAAALSKSERVIRNALRRKDPTAHVPVCPWHLSTYEYMGAFRVDRGLIVADRCYVNHDHILLATRTPALTGTWHAYLRYDPDFEGRTVSILVVHENHFERAKEPGEPIGHFGVDAGCGVIVDQRVLENAELLHALTQTSDWDEGMIDDCGVFAYTYDGDGMYSVRGIRHGGDIVAIRANVSRDKDYDYHIPPPPEEYTKSLDEAMAAAGPAEPYAITATFVVGDRVTHKKFGEGLVTKIIDAGKVEISFPDGVKTLVQGQKK